MKKPKPLATVGDMEIHRAKFHPYEMVKYLDIPTLKKAAKAQIEIGRVEGGGVETTIVAEIRKGMITKLTPIGCKGCTEAKRTRRKGDGSAKKEALRAALVRVRELGGTGLKLPIPLKSYRSLLIKIGPLVIHLWPLDFCIVFETDDGDLCSFCLLSGSETCIGPGPLGM